MRSFLNFLTAAVLGASFLCPATSLAQPQDKDDQAKVRQEKKEEHPVIRRAIRQLEGVKNELTTKAASDFGGHKAEAIKAIDEAIEHLNQAMSYDKK